jgi:hypothetical protein
MPEGSLVHALALNPPFIVAGISCLIAAGLSLMLKARKRRNPPDNIVFLFSPQRHKGRRETAKKPQKSLIRAFPLCTAILQHLVFRQGFL